VVFDGGPRWPGLTSPGEEIGARTCGASDLTEAKWGLIQPCFRSPRRWASLHDGPSPGGGGARRHGLDRLCNIAAGGGCGMPDSERAWVTPLTGSAVALARDRRPSAPLLGWSQPGTAAPNLGTGRDPSGTPGPGTDAAVRAPRLRTDSPRCLRNAPGAPFAKRWEVILRWESLPAPRRVAGRPSVTGVNSASVCASALAPLRRAVALPCKQQQRRLRLAPSCGEDAGGIASRGKTSG
jgi:hypothetical protein